MFLEFDGLKTANKKFGSYVQKDRSRSKLSSFCKGRLSQANRSNRDKSNTNALSVKNDLFSILNKADSRKMIKLSDLV